MVIMAVGYVIEAGQQVDDGGFAAAGRAQDGGNLSGFGVEVDLAQSRRPVLVGEAHIIKTNVSMRVGPCPRRLLFPRRGIGCRAR